MEQGRLFKIVYYLLDKGRTTAPELAEKLEVSVRTIYRDLDVLSVAGIPIYTTQGKGGGIHLVVGVEGIGPLLAHGQGEAADTVGGYVEPEHDVGGA